MNLFLEVCACVFIIHGEYIIAACVLPPNNVHAVVPYTKSNIILFYFEKMNFFYKIKTKTIERNVCFCPSENSKMVEKSSTI